MSMFERFTPPARRVLGVAQDEAKALNYMHVGTEHLLIGVLRESQSAARTLEEVGINLEDVRRDVDAALTGREPHTYAHIPLTLGAKRALELSSTESERLGHDHAGPEHILLCLIDEDGGFLSQLLLRRQIDVNHVRRELIAQAEG